MDGLCFGNLTKENVFDATCWWHYSIGVNVTSYIASLNSSFPWACTSGWSNSPTSSEGPPVVAGVFSFVVGIAVSAPASSGWSPSSYQETNHAIERHCSSPALDSTTLVSLGIARLVFTATCALLREATTSSVCSCSSFSNFLSC
jgi:hypothetical protein